MADQANPFDQNQQPTPEMQPVAGAPMQPQNVQYVVMEKSNNGLSGWLIFFLICFGFAAIYGLIGFFGFLAAAINSPSGPVIVSLIFTPFIAAGSILSIVFIAMQKKLGKWFAVGTYALSALYVSILIPVSVFAACDAVSSYSNYYYSCSIGSEDVIMMIGSILVAWVAAGLYSLYFFLSKRVKATLIK